MRKGEAATISYIQANLHVCVSRITVVTVVVRERDQVARRGGGKNKQYIHDQKREKMKRLQHIRPSYSYRPLHLYSGVAAPRLVQCLT